MKECPMHPKDGPGLVDTMVTILSPLIVMVLTAVFLLGWWAEAVWRGQYHQDRRNKRRGV